MGREIVGGEDYQRQGGLLGVEDFQQAMAVHSGQLEIEHHEVRLGMAADLKRLRGVRSGEDLGISGRVGKHRLEAFAVILDADGQPLRGVD